jgi:hypothetical protein
VDPDPILHVDADPDPDPNKHQNDAGPHADPIPGFTHVGKSEYLFNFFLVTALPVRNFLEEK